MTQNVIRHINRIFLAMAVLLSVLALGQQAVRAETLLAEEPEGKIDETSTLEWNTFLGGIDAPEVLGPFGVTTDRTPDLTWSSVPDAENYQIRIFTGSTILYDSEGSGHVIASTQCEGGVCTWDSTEYGQVLSRGNYTWQVCSCLFGVCSSWAEKEFSIIPDAPVLLSPGEDGPTELIIYNPLSFTWQDTVTNNVQAYQLNIEKKNSSDDTWLALSSVTVAKTACEEQPGGIMGCEYQWGESLETGYYRWFVKGVEVTTSESALARYFNAIGVLTLPDRNSMQPDGRIRGDETDPSPNLSWEEVSGVTTYVVEVYRFSPVRSLVYQSEALTPALGDDVLDCFTLSRRCILDGDIAFDPPLSKGNYEWRVQVKNDFYSEGIWTDSIFLEILDEGGNAPALQWNTFIEGDYGKAVATGLDGSIYVVGESYKSWGEPIRPYAGNRDAWVAKFSRSGQLLWNTFLGSTEYDEGSGITVDKDGNVYVVGESYEPWGEPIRGFSGDSIYNNIYTDAYLAKLDGDGTLIWNTFLGSIDNDGADSVVLDASGNIYVVGNGNRDWGNWVFQEYLDKGAFIAKLDNNGDLIWNTFVGGITLGEYYYNGNGLAVNERGEVYLSTICRDSWGTPLNPISGNLDISITKLGVNGGKIWNTFVGGTGDDLPSALVLDSDENIYVTGFSYSKWYESVNPYSGGDFDGLVVKLDKNGEKQWHTFFGGINRDITRDIVIDRLGQIEVVGTSRSTWGAPARGYSGGEDLFIVGIDANGNVLWNTFLGGESYDYGYGLSVDTGQNLVVVGYGRSNWGTLNPRVSDGAFVALLGEIVPPQALSILEPEGNISNTTPDFIWQDVDDADNYQLLLRREGQFVYSSKLAGHLISYTKCQEEKCTWSASDYGKTLAAGHYEVLVSACSLSHCGIWVNKKFVILPTSPDNLMPGGEVAPGSLLSENSVDFTWQDDLNNKTNLYLLSIEKKDPETNDWLPAFNFNVSVTACTNMSNGLDNSCSFRVVLDTGYSYRWQVIAKVSSLNAASVRQYFSVGGIPTLTIENMLPNSINGGVITDTAPDLSWSFLSDVETYSLEFYRIDPFKKMIYRGQGLTPAVDGDSLKCDMARCVSNGSKIFPSKLTEGVYAWRVGIKLVGNPDISWSPGVNLTISETETPISSGISELVWDKAIGKLDYYNALYSDSYADLAYDKSGNVVVVGTSKFLWDNQRTPIRPLSGGTDAFVSKLDKSGNLAWVTFLGGEKDDLGLTVDVDGVGNVYVVGRSIYQTWGSPIIPYHNNGREDFIAKLDSNGTLLWHAFLGVCSFDLGSRVAFDQVNKAIYVTGGANNVFLIKMNEEGAVLWTKYLGGTGIDNGIVIDIDGKGDVILSGYSSSSWGMPVNAFVDNHFLTNYLPGDVFVAKVDRNGNLIWNTFMGTATSGGSSVAVTLDGAGNTYITGSSQLYWGTPKRSCLDKDAFVAKLDRDGVRQWNTCLGGSDVDTGGSIVWDGKDGIFVSGRSRSSWGVPQKKFGGENDVFIAKLTVDGSYQWHTFVGHYNASLPVNGGRVLANGSDRIYVLGYSSPDKFFVAAFDEKVSGLPENIAADKNFDTRSPCLEWSPVSEAASYQLTIQKDSAIVYDSLAMGHTIPRTLCQDNRCTWDLARQAIILPRGSYTWAVRGCRLGGCGPWVSGRFMVVPESPYNLTPGENMPTEFEVSQNPATLEWDDMLTNTAQSYMLTVEKRNYSTKDWETNQSLSLFATECTIVGGGEYRHCSIALANSLGIGYYRWHVTAIETTSSASAANKYFWVPGVPLAPIAGQMRPNSNMGDNISDLTPDLSWDVDHGITTYTVEVYVSSSGLTPAYRFSSLTPVAGGDVLDCSLTAEKCTLNGNLVFTPPLSIGTYTWRVQAEREGYGMGPWSEKVSFQVGPLSPVLLSPLEGKFEHTKPSFQWERVAGVEYYQFLLETQQEGAWKTLWQTELADSKCATGASTQCILPLKQQLNSGDVYRWSVRSYKNNYGPWASVIRFTVSPAPIALELVSPGGGGEFQPASGYFVWLPVEDATHYQLMIKQGSSVRYYNENDLLLAGEVCPGVANRGPDTCSVNLAGLMTPAKKHPALPAGKAVYQWQVRAGRKGDGIFSPWSVPLTFSVSKVLRWNTFLGNDTAGVNVKDIAMSLDGFEYSIIEGNGTTLIKLDANGNKVWRVDYPMALYGTRLLVDESGALYMVGAANEVPWSAPIRPQSGGKDAFVVKFNKNGQVLWHTFLGGVQDDNAYGIDLGQGGSIYITGQSAESWGIPLRSYSGAGDAFVASLDSGGNLVWNTFLGGAAYDDGVSVGVDDAGNISVIGNSQAAWGTPNRDYQGSGESFAAGLDPNGNLMWNTFLGGSLEDMGIAHVVAQNGSIYIAGKSIATWGSPITAFAGREDGFVAKLDSEGGLLWHTFVGGSGLDDVKDIILNSSENILLGGKSDVSWGRPLRVFQNHFDVDHQDGYVAGLSKNGMRLWNMFIGGQGFDDVDAIAMYADANLYVAGFSNNAVDLTRVDSVTGEPLQIPGTWGTPVEAYYWSDSQHGDAMWASLDIPGSSLNPYGANLIPVIRSPLAATTDLTPDFFWQDVSNASSYQVVVRKGKAVVYDSVASGQGIFHENCLAGICSLKADQYHLTLSQGKYNWSVRVCLTGARCGAWVSKNFVIEPLPPKGMSASMQEKTDFEETSPLQLHWHDVLENETKIYQLVIEQRNPVSQKWVQIKRQSLNRTQVCTSGIGNKLDCAYVYNKPLVAGFYRWRLQSSNGSYSGFTINRYFWMPGAPLAPAKNTLVLDSVFGDGTDNVAPALSWEAVHGATTYYVEVYRTKPTKALVYQSTALTIAAGDDGLDCVSTLGRCLLSGSVFSGTPLSKGIYTWKIQAEDPQYGKGKWSLLATFQVGPSAPVTIGSEGKLTRSKPEFVWNLVAQTPLYQVKIERQALKAGSPWLALTTMNIKQSSCGSSGVGTCKATVKANLSLLYRYRWAVRGVDTGNGPWSQWVEFTVPTNPSTPNLISPIEGANMVLSGPLTWTQSENATHHRIKIMLGNKTVFYNAKAIFPTGLDYCGWPVYGECRVSLQELYSSSGKPIALSPGKTYKWFVQGYREGDDIASSWSGGGLFTYTP